MIIFLFSCLKNSEIYNKHQTCLMGKEQKKWDLQHSKEKFDEGQVDTAPQATRVGCRTETE